MAAPLVDWHIGRMPLVITCPHDGRAEPPGVPERPDDQAGCLTKKQADLSTRTIALGLSSAVQVLIGLEPSMVVARFHRRYIDANRPEKCAFVARERGPSIASMLGSHGECRRRSQLVAHPLDDLATAHEAFRISPRPVD